MASFLSEYRKTDGEIAPNLIYQVGRIDSIIANKAYDQSRVYEASNDHMNEACQINIHPRANERIEHSIWCLRWRVKILVDAQTTVSAKLHVQRESEWTSSPE